MQRTVHRLMAALGVIALALSTFLCATPAFAVGSDGTITVTSTNPEFNGKTVTVYQMFDETGTGDSAHYDLVDTWEDFFTTAVNQGGVGLSGTGDELSDAAYTYIKGLEESELPAFAKKASDWAKDASHGITGTTSGAATLSGSIYAATVSNLAYGYYVVSPQTGSTPTTGGTYVGRGTDAILVNVKTSTPVTQELKSTYPTAVKTVQVGDGAAGDHASAQVGDTLTFTLTSKVPDTSEYTDHYQFAFVDTLSDGLTFGEIKSVQINGTDVDAANYHAMSPTGNGGMLRIDFGTQKTVDDGPIYNAKELFDGKAGQTITVVYTATLNENAEVAQDQTNSVHVEYSNNPGTTGTGSSHETETHQYTFGFELNKTDGTTGLAGAVFELWDKDNHPIQLVKVADESELTYRPAKLDTPPSTYETGAVTQVTTPEGGTIHFVGLAEGTYTLHEVSAPDGYNKVAADPTVTISATYHEDGTLDSWTVNSNGQNPVEVVNNAGAILPGTGGMGTVVFTVVGVVVVAAGVAWYLRHNKGTN